MTTDEDALRRICNLYKELQDKGYLKDAELVFDESEEKEIRDIFDKHIPDA